MDHHDHGVGAMPVAGWIQVALMLVVLVLGVWVLARMGDIRTPEGEQEDCPSPVHDPESDEYDGADPHRCSICGGTGKIPKEGK